MIIFLISTCYLTIYQPAHYCTELKSGEITNDPIYNICYCYYFSIIGTIFRSMNKTLYVNLEYNTKEIYFYTVFKYRSKTVSRSRSKFK